MLPKPSKEFATRYIQNLLPEYGWMLSKIDKDGGWINFESWLYKVLDNLKITDYAKHYTDESILPKLLIVALFDIDEFKTTAAELEQASDEERTAFLDDFIISIEQGELDAAWEFEIPKTQAEEEQARKLFESLNEEERTDACKRGVCFFVFFMINFHNYLAVMVHGRMITQLVAEAIQGDDNALVLAAQIDPSVMQSIPYFWQREAKAYREGDSHFLDKLAYRKRIPPLQGKIRYPLLYLTFAMLDGMNILNNLTCSEILDICDTAGLDRWQNRIEDEGYLAKRLREYRRFQIHKSIY